MSAASVLQEPEDGGEVTVTQTASGVSAWSTEHGLTAGLQLTHTNLLSQSTVFRPEWRQRFSNRGAARTACTASSSGQGTAGKHCNLVLLWISHHVGKSGFFLRGRKGRKMQAEADLWLYLFYLVRKWSMPHAHQNSARLSISGKEAANSGL